MEILYTASSPGSGTNGFTRCVFGGWRRQSVSNELRIFIITFYNQSDVMCITCMTEHFSFFDEYHKMVSALRVGV